MAFTLFILIVNQFRQMPNLVQLYQENAPTTAKTVTTKKIRPIDFNYVGLNGLGHRLTRMASAYHLAVKLNSVERIIPDWKNCEGPLPTLNQSTGYQSFIWDHLFGPQNVTIPDETFFGPEINRGVVDFRRGLCHRSKSNVTLPNGTNVLRVRMINACPGYAPRKYVGNLDTMHLPFLLSKQRTDEAFYEMLRSRFMAIHKNRVDRFFEKNGIDFSQSLVVGLHLRVGNDKDRDFVKKNRLVSHVPTLCKKMILLVSEYLERHSLFDAARPVILFVATDGPVALHHLNDTIRGHGVPVKLVSLEQEEVEFLGTSFNLAGVSSDAKYEHCIKSWENSMVDMALLSMSDVVIAGVYSSYVQSMPLSLVLSRQGETKWAPKGSDKWPASFKPFPPYCEVGPMGEIMTCHKTFSSILGLNVVPNITTFQYRLQNDTAWDINSRHIHEFGVPQLKAPCSYCAGLLKENNLC
jgi:hypothetical protein